MTELELILLLEQINEKTFIEKFLIIAEKSKDYRKSDFYKITKIELGQLYEKFYIYSQNKYSLYEKVVEFVSSIRDEEVINKVISILNMILDDEKVKEIVENISSKFDFNSLKGETDKLSGLLEKLKK